MSEEPEDMMCSLLRVDYIKVYFNVQPVLKKCNFISDLKTKKKEIVIFFGGGGD